MYEFTRQFRLLLTTSLLVAAGLPLAARTLSQIPTVPPPPGDAAPTQSSYPPCQPPNAGEYLLLVVSKTPDVQEKVKQTLPPSATSTVCNYVDQVVTRVGGFTSADTANAWARYLSDSSGLSAFVARPTNASTNQVTAPPLVQTSSAPPQIPQTPQAAQSPATSSQVTKAPQVKAPVQTATASTHNPLAFNPKPLGTGYAVLVNYFNRPELATQVQRLLGREVGLVSYGQRPYLLATYTTNQASAHATLQKLTDRGFWAMVVDSRRVTLLRQTINLKQTTAKD